MAQAILKIYKAPIQLLLDKTIDIITSMASNTCYPNPSPGLHQLREAFSRLELCYTLALQGDKQKRKDLRLRKAELEQLLKQLRQYVQEKSGGDTKKILAAGMSVKKQKSRQKAGR